ncbi:glycosyltransferase family 4 protein [Patulibacter americanus]|uniref:glycosyltransferase family 4 protein n=1 Tax=Patulibacter americanus TaxID=588672 RepID=UPI000415B2F5|nr:glycosyltransferase family 1 protein [Patulibacter americanus]
MRFVIDARAAAEVPAGRGRYIRELLIAMAARDDDHEYELLAREPWTALQRDARFGWRTVAGRDPGWALAAARSARHGDALLSTASYLLAAASPVPTVATVFDLVAFDPETSPPLGALAERATLPLALRRNTTFACISEATKHELTARFPSAAARATVTPLGVDQTFARRAAARTDVIARLGLPDRYVLSVGTREPRKNLVRAIDAFVGLPEAVRDGRRLVVAGHRGWQDEDIDRAIDGAGELVHVTGFVEDDDLPAVYAAADAFVYASFHEGFGLPVLEAMAVGTPVITSNVSSLPEVAGDAAVTVDPRSVAAIRDGLAGVLADPDRAADFGRRGRARAAEFTWARTAAVTLAMLVAAAEGH